MGNEPQPVVARNKTVAVIGAGDYIGAAIVRRFAAGGYTVVAGRRNGDKLAPLVDEIAAQGGRCIGRSRARSRVISSPTRCCAPVSPNGSTASHCACSAAGTRASVSSSEEKKCFIEKGNLGT